MPTVAVDKLELFERLGRSYSQFLFFGPDNSTQSGLATEEFDHLCFEFGIELDEDVRHRSIAHIINGICVSR